MENYRQIIQERTKDFYAQLFTCTPSGCCIDAYALPLIDEAAAPLIAATADDSSARLCVTGSSFADFTCRNAEISLSSAAPEFDSPEKLELLAKALNSCITNIEFAAEGDFRVRLSFKMPVYSLISQNEE